MRGGAGQVGSISTYLIFCGCRAGAGAGAIISCSHYIISLELKAKLYTFSMQIIKILNMLSELSFLYQNIESPLNISIPFF